MRHVDDAHDAEGDGKPDRGEQQYRAERNPVPDVLRRVPDRKALLDGGDRFLRRLADGGRRIVGKRAQDTFGVVVAARGKRLDGRHPVGLRDLRIGDDDRGARRFENALDRGVGFLGERCIDRRERRGVARFEDRLGGGAPARRIGREQVQRSERRFDRAAHQIVDAHFLQAERRFAGDGLAGRRVDHRAGGVLDVDLAVGLGEIEPPVLERADDVGRALVAGRRDGAERRDGLRIAVLGEAAERAGKIVGARRAVETYLGKEKQKS